MQTTYNIKKASIGVITFLGLATMSLQNTSLTSGISNTNMHVPAYVVNDRQGAVCMSSCLADKTAGDIVVAVESKDLLPIRHKVKNAKLYIKEIKKHVSSFDFEDEYEEI